MGKIGDCRTVRIEDLRPYEKNARVHTSAQIAKIAHSIRRYGFISPVIIDRDRNVIAGHGRIQAAKSIGMKEVPCVLIEDLSDQERREYIHVDNKLSELSSWDKGILDVELQELPELIEFGFKLPDLAFDVSYYGDAREQTFRKYNLESFDEARSAGIYDIPVIEKTNFVPGNLIGFNYAKSTKQRDTGIHFFIDDYQFERLWTSPDKYIDLLSEFECVLTPDFSLYLDMPLAIKIWNVYRSRLIGQMMQDAGITVIPTIQFAGEETYCFAFDGLPEGGTVATSTVGVMNDSSSRDLWKKGMEEAVKRLKPKTLIIYGSDRIEFDHGDLEIKYFEARKFGE